MATLMNDERLDEKVIIAFCDKINRRSGIFHLEERVLWFCLKEVKVYVIKQQWGTGVDILKLNSNAALKTFILKIFSSQKFTNYDIKIGNSALMKDIVKVSFFILRYFDTDFFNAFHSVGEIDDSTRR